MKKLIYTLVFCFNLFCSQIDVVIPVHKKDAPTIDVVIKAVRENIINLRDVYVISKEIYTDNAIWIDEKEFPFSIDDVGNELGRIGVGKHVRRGWYYQQLLKFYAHRVIDGLSQSFLILDADTCPNHPMLFVDEDGRTYLDHLRAACFMNTYYAFMTAMIPSIDDVDQEVNPVVHHMVFNHEILDDLFDRVEELYKEPFWKVFSHLVRGAGQPDGNMFYAGASEYMLYFFFCQFYHPDKIINRVIEMEHKAKSLSKDYGEKYDFICKHNYDRTE